MQLFFFFFFIIFLFILAKRDHTLSLLAGALPLREWLSEIIPFDKRILPTTNQIRQKAWGSPIWQGNWTPLQLQKVGPRFSSLEVDWNGILLLPSIPKQTTCNIVIFYLDPHYNLLILPPTRYYPRDLWLGPHKL